MSAFVASIGLPEIVAALMVLALNAYALMGGADFGGGLWDLLASGPRRDAQRALIADSIAPIWEANHVWLIVVVVVLFTGFPVAFATLGTVLHIPISLMLIGIVLRGSAFVFRSYGSRDRSRRKQWGLTFAIAMKAFLRADPDIIMVGEMRDKETVSTGIEASLTGHLVFATLHTNSAPESIVRLLDMGMDPFNFSDALLGILAQRLAKRLCAKCKKAHPATKEELHLLMEEYSIELMNTETWKKDPEAAREKLLESWKNEFGNDKGEIMLNVATGCDTCGKTGYKGRVGLHELLIGTDAVKKNIQEHARVAEIFATALEEGMRTLKQDGIEKVLLGITDIAQVRAVCIK